MTLDQKFVKKRVHFMPAPCAAAHITPLIKGFLSTRMLCHATTATEAVYLGRAEDAELVQAAKHGGVVVDDSLPARPVAVVLLIYGSTPTTASSMAYLNAIGCFAAAKTDESSSSSPRMASLMRFTVLAAEDAEWFAQKVEPQTLNSGPHIVNSTAELCVRWAVAGGTGMLRSEFCSLKHECSLTSALEQVQNFMLSMKLAYDVPMPDGITRSHPNIRSDAWAHTLHDSTAEFFDLMEGEPCVVKSQMLEKHSHEVTIEPTEVFLRIAPRRHMDHLQKRVIELTPSMAANHPEAFHAFLLGNSNFMQQIVKFCQSNAQGGLPHSDQETELFLLHTCAVQASPTHLNQRVSLFGGHDGLGRAPGSHISLPGSMMWRFDPAIVPLDNVLRDFYVLPCSRTSALPGDAKLERPFALFFDRAFRLYSTFAQGGSVHKRAPPSPELQSDTTDTTDQDQELFALHSFGIDATSPTMTTGDAYAVLRLSSAPPQLTRFMLSSCVRNGVNSTVLDSLASAAAALEMLQNGLDSYDHNEVKRLKRVADASLEVNCGSDKKRPCSQSPLGVHMQGAKVRSLLAACGLVKGEEAVVHFKDMVLENGFEKVVGVLASSVSPTASSESKLHATQAARRSQVDVLASISSSMCVLRAEKGSYAAPAFLICHEKVDSHSENAESVRFHRVLPSGQLANSTPGEIVDTAMAVVVLVRIGKSVRVTATVRD